jgi:hypothetical protein
MSWNKHSKGTDDFTSDVNGPQPRPRRSTAPYRPPSTVPRGPSPSLTCMRAVQITRFGGPEVLDVADLPDPAPGDGQQLYEVSSAGVNFADTHHRLTSAHTNL